MQLLYTTSSASLPAVCTTSDLTVKTEQNAKDHKMVGSFLCLSLIHKTFSEESAVLLPCQFLILHVKQTRMANGLLPGTVL